LANGDPKKVAQKIIDKGFEQLKPELKRIGRSQIGGQAYEAIQAYDELGDTIAKVRREIEGLESVQRDIQRRFAGVKEGTTQYSSLNEELAGINDKIATQTRHLDKLESKNVGVTKSLPKWAEAESKATKYLGSLERQILGVKNLIANNKELQYTLGALAIASGAVGKTFKFATGIIQGLYKGIKTTTEYVLTLPVKIGEWAGKIGNSIRQELVEVIGQAVENTKEFFDLSSNGGSAMSRLGSIASGALGSFQSVNSEMTKMFGFGAQGASNMIQQLSQGINSMGVFSEIFADSTAKSGKSIEFYYKMTKGLGMSAEDTKYIVLEAAKNGEHYFATMTRVKESADVASKEFGINRKRLSMGFFELRKDIVNFGHLTEPELMKVVGKATQLGVEVKELTAVFGKFDTFESAAQSAAMLQQTFGMNVDALKLIKAEDPMDIVEMFRESMLMTGRSFDDLNRHEKSLMASHTGMSAEALKTIMNFRNLGKSYAEIKKQMNDQKPEERQIRAMKDMKSSFTEVKKVIEGKGFFENFLDGVKTTIKYNSQLGRAFVKVSQRMEDFYEKGLSLSKNQKRQMDAIFKPFTNILDNLIGPKGPFSKNSFDKLKDGVLKNLSEFVEDIFGDKTGMRMNLLEAQRKWQSRVKEMLTFDNIMKDQTFIGKIFKTTGKIVGTIVQALVVAIPSIAEGFAALVNGGLSAVDEFLSPSNKGFSSSIMTWLGLDADQNKEVGQGLARGFKELKRIFIGDGNQEGIITVAFNKILSIASNIGTKILDGFKNNKGAIMELTDQLSFGFFNKFMMFASRSPLFSSLISEDAARSAGKQYSQGIMKRYSGKEAADAILSDAKYGNAIGDLDDEGQYNIAGTLGGYADILSQKRKVAGYTAGANTYDAFLRANEQGEGKTGYSGNLTTVLSNIAERQSASSAYIENSTVIRRLFGSSSKKLSQAHQDLLTSMKGKSSSKAYTLAVQGVKNQLKKVAEEQNGILEQIAKQKQASEAEGFGVTAAAGDPPPLLELDTKGFKVNRKEQMAGLDPNKGYAPNTNLDGSTGSMVGKKRREDPDNIKYTYGFKVSQASMSAQDRERYLADSSGGLYTKGLLELRGDDRQLTDGSMGSLKYTKASGELMKAIQSLSADEALIGRTLGISKKDMEILMNSQEAHIQELRELYLQSIGNQKGQNDVIITIDGYEIASIIENKQNEQQFDASRHKSTAPTSRADLRNTAVSNK